MSEEFVENIIAASELAENTEDNAQAADNINNENNVVAEKVVEETIEEATADDKSASITEEESHTNDDTDSGSDDSSSAPGDLSEVEALASKLGWNKDHTGAEAVDAATYILRSKDIQKTMKDHNKDLKSQLNGLKGSVEALKEHNDRIYQVELKRLKSELSVLKKEKKAAVELADVKKVEELDQQIEEVQKDLNAPEPKETATNNPAYDEWIVDNEWYLTDKAMAAYADTVAEQYIGAPAERIYAIVKQKVAEVFPEKFAAETVNADVLKAKTLSPATDANNGDSDKAVEKVIGPKSPVEKGSRNGETANFTKADLSADQLMIMNQFVKGGIMTEDQYIADIAKLQGV